LRTEELTVPVEKLVMCNAQRHTVGHKGRKKKRNKEGQRKREKGTLNREQENIQDA